MNKAGLLRWFKPKTKTPNDRRSLGDIYEQQAKQFLQQQGLRIVAENFHCRFGEIDVIAFDDKQNMLVIVEVRYRNSDFYGGAAASVTKNKQAKLKKTALFYLATRKLDTQVRFDVIAIEHQQLNWIQSAFT